MDLFFEIYAYLTDECGFMLSRIFRGSIHKGIELRIYCDDKLIILEKDEDFTQQELIYLRAAKLLIQWAIRNELHASSSTRKEPQWLDMLKEQLGITDDEYLPKSRWEMLSVPASE